MPKIAQLFCFQVIYFGMMSKIFKIVNNLTFFAFTSNVICVLPLSVNLLKSKNPPPQ
ncbi:hypothetical protein Halhy_3505 [Haliscomenobacter hydrossis DSM 1100]|uniref:Uncharacterized protein n=1 Tax=Haliscomenobacter hydrossis (strain ATCC 27775 / DSM 1100 / LMG 10767 / O) TaxID=760192 RepID=F4KWM0_HALH1|nr:hypothetical protein Halhy_3505 [Haliscomenobacter hydrossis DSM 1100]